MVNDINHYVTFVTQKNGRSKPSFTEEGVSNIYRMLFDMGYRTAILDHKRYYFQIVEKEYQIVKLQIIQAVFRDLLKHNQLYNLPESIYMSDIIDLYFKKAPIRNSLMMDQFLKMELNDKDIHLLRMSADPKYNDRFHHDQLLMFLNNNHFKNVLDTFGGIHFNMPLYYKYIGVQQYLIFSHYNFKKLKNRYGFNCWLAVYADESHVGTSKPLHLLSVKSNFSIETDMHLISNYMKYSIDGVMLEDFPPLITSKEEELGEQKEELSIISNV